MGDADKSEKERFVREWLICGNPYKAALLLYPNVADQAKALKMGAEWPLDWDVIRIKDDMLQKHGKAEFLPDREDTARIALDIAISKSGDGSSFKYPAEQRLKALKLYSEIRGFIDNDIVPTDNQQRDILNELAEMLPS